MSTGPTRILVATDFSAHAQHALDYAATIARDRGARLILVHSLDAPDPLTMVGGSLKPLIDMGAATARAEELLQAEARRAQLGQLLDVAEVRKHRPEQEILAAAQSHGADLVVMGTRGNRGVQRFMLGSVSERVARACPVPVLIVPLPAGAEEGSG
jgi:nucleotide-binding universal stress UspA family protein